MDARVVDISHHNDVRDLRLTAGAGVWGIIHKATQGRAYRDPDYDRRRLMAKDAGLLWGAYHFNTGDSVKAQVDFFLSTAKPDDATLLVLDYEDNRLSNMNIEQVVDFLHHLEQRTGRKGALYSGNRVKETIGQLGKVERDYLTSHRLWLCQYGPVPRLPAGFSSWWLWQFTGDGVGPKPHSVPGIMGNGIDVNTFNGSRDDLAASWAIAATVNPPAARTGTVASNGLNVRSEPSSISPVVRTLAKGETVTILGEEMNGATKWFHIADGYVAARYVDLKS